MNEVKIPPILVKGDHRCLYFRSEKTDHIVNICLNDKNESDQITDSIKFFKDCIYKTNNTTSRLCKENNKTLDILNITKKLLK
jgi:hypothetical protein